jgi:hypothetical protein
MLDYIKFDRKSISFGESILEFDEPLSEVIIVARKYIVFRIDTETQENDRNVFCYGFDGVLQWIIVANDYPDGKSQVSSIYMMNGKLYAFRYCGVEEEINLNNGEILHSELIK